MVFKAKHFILILDLMPKKEYLYFTKKNDQIQSEAWLFLQMRKRGDGRQTGGGKRGQSVFLVLVLVLVGMGGKRVEVKEGSRFS